MKYLFSIIFVLVISLYEYNRHLYEDKYKELANAYFILTFEMAEQNEYIERLQTVNKHICEDN